MGNRERVRLNSRRPRIRLRRRVHDVWEPTWDSSIAGWTKKFIKDNYWRTETFNDMEDLMQDAYVVFLKVKDSYPKVVDGALFMRMYKTALWRFFMDKGRKLKNDILTERYMKHGFLAFDKELGYDETRLQEMLTLNEEKHQSVLENSRGAVDYNSGPLAVMLSDSPPEIKLLLEFLSKDENLEKLREPQRTKPSEPRVSQDRRLSNLLGIDYYPFRKSIKNWLYA